MLERVRKIRVPEELGQSAKLNSYHCDIDPSFGAGFRPLVIAHQTPVAHEPAEGPLHDPPPGQDLEARDIVGAFDDFNIQFWAQTSHPLGKFRYPPSTHILRSQVNQQSTRLSRLWAPSRSGTLATVTSTPSTNPSVSTSK